MILKIGHCKFVIGYRNTAQRNLQNRREIAGVSFRFP